MNIYRVLKMSLVILLSVSVTKSIADPAEHLSNNTAKIETKTAIFAGGCFWCTESDFEQLPGVIEVISGYANGHTPDPTYQAVSAGGTGFTEAVKVVYNPKVVDYAKLLDVYWRTIDPTVENRQFCDVGSQYRSGIYYEDASQEQEALASLAALKQSGRFEKIFTEVKPLTSFYPAEDYHQDYYKKNPVRYQLYRYGCGRDRRLEAVWGS